MGPNEKVSDRRHATWASLIPVPGLGWKMLGREGGWERDLLRGGAEAISEDWGAFGRERDDRGGGG